MPGATRKTLLIYTLPGLEPKYQQLQSLSNGQEFNMTNFKMQQLQSKSNGEIFPIGIIGRLMFFRKKEKDKNCLATNNVLGRYFDL